MPISKQQLSNPELIRVKDSGGFYMGGAQSWFPDSWKRTSGCGPTAASGMMWYLARSRGSSAICETGNADKSNFLKLMNTVFDYVRPGLMGVNSTGIFVNGITRYGNSCGIRLRTRVLNIPPALFIRPSIEVLRDFILESLRSDLPLAFLNLSNGSLENISGWHWVMLIALEPDSMLATVCDYGAAKEINLGEWLITTVLGGGFVSVLP